MAKPYFKINGVDILHLTQEKGVQWKRNDVDSPRAGRTMDAVMHRGRVAEKYTANITCVDMTRAEELALMALINPEFVTVETNLHPLYESQAAQYYSNNVPATISYIDPDTGESWWTGISFPLVEQ